MNFEKYIGIPYAEKGRDETGLDCYGLVRLIYKNELKIDLPSFSAEYTQTDTARIEELIAQYKEGWEQTEEPVVGSIVLFRVFGNESHIGVVISPTHFIHVRENQDTVIESLSSTSWKKRTIGYFNYSEKKSVILNAVPHPLRTERYTMPIVPGTTLKVLAEGLTKEYKIAPELKSKVSVMVNGIVIPEDKWQDVILKEGDAVEYRAVPGKSAVRLLALVAIAYFAPYLASSAEFAYMGTAAATAAGSAAVYATAYAATVLIGSALVNAIAPIRPPSGGAGGNAKDPGSAERQLMINGGANRITPYSAIPVVLGKIRMTPPLGSYNYLTYENERNSYLSMLLTWGYGPLVIDANTLRIGEVPLTSFTDYNYITANRITELNSDQERAFNSIYGKDITQVNTAVELTCDGNPENIPRYFTGGSSYYPSTVGEFGDFTPGYNTIKYEFRAISGWLVGERATITFTVPSGHSNWTLIYNRVSNVVVTDVSSTVKKVVCTIDDISALSSYVELKVDSETIIIGSYEVTSDGVAPGPWFEAATGIEYDSFGNPVPVTSATIAIHFPQGLRGIWTKGESAGDSFATEVKIRTEISSDAGLTWTYSEVLTIGGNAVKKDAFTATTTYSNFDNNQMLIRVRRETGDNVEDNPSKRYYFTSILQNVTFLRNNKPAVDPVGSKIAKTAFKIKATDQLNGSIQGISAVVQTYCKIWNGSTWLNGATSNPAALMRYVLEHPANPRKITDAASQINLTQLQYFYEYCESKGFEYNSILGESRSILEVIRDICAAGRASPSLVDGKWTVVIDEAKSAVVQHFTPHNSWGFEGSKGLPKRPDGLRVNFYDQDKDYQESEIIVYDIGKNSGNSSLFESITLPGVTKKSLVIDHARWHMAQIKLRPEIYTLNSDIEYLVCNRGDRVKVMHDVPMWGLGSGRIKTRISSTSLELDESLPMQAGVTYTMRFRSKTGQSVVRNLLPKIADGYYTQIDLVSAVTEDEADVLDLFLFGELQQESQDLVVLSIEPVANNSARLTLVDYGVTSDYNIFTDYQNLTESTVFESQITLPPSLQLNSFGTKFPQITGFVSDESAMERIYKGVFKYNIRVAFVNAAQLPINVDRVEVQYDLLNSNDSLNFRSVFVPYQNGAASISDVNEGEEYKIRMRYVSTDGFLSNWSPYSTHVVVGKINPPTQVNGFSVSADKSSGQLLLTWFDNPEPDTSTYEIRTQDSGWGEDINYRLFFGDSTRTFIKYALNDPSTFYIRAVDTSGKYSQVSSVVSFTPSEVPNVIDIDHSYSDTALTSANVVLSWQDVTNSEFDIAYYELTYENNVKTVKGNTITVAADWLGDRVFTIKSVDIQGNKSSGYSESISKLAPNPVTDLRTQVIDNTVMLYWTLPERTSLPIDHVLIKKGVSWENSVIIGEKKGGFTTQLENQGGRYTYWLSAVDTEGVESIPVSITTLVDEPPDFIFNGEFSSTFSGNTSSAIFDNSVLALPVNTEETWQQHFTTRSWSTPQDQITAGYPIFIQPNTSSGYYEETFDFGVVLSSSRIVLTYQGTRIAGNPLITTKISLSVDNSTFVDYNGVTDVFGTNFRYVKIRITVTATTDKDLYEISQISLRSDSKLKNDAGNRNVNVSDTLGSIVNFNKEFIDIQSITISPSGTTPIIPTYDFNDNILSATYVVSSNECLVTSNSHNFISGQKVKLYFSSGAGISGVYTIMNYTANTFRVAMTVADTSGAVTVYPQSFRLYLFNESGARVSANTSWAIKGY